MMIALRVCAAAALFAVAACQQLPLNLPYSVSDDCRVQRQTAAPAANAMHSALNVPVSRRSTSLQPVLLAASDSSSDYPGEGRRPREGRRSGGGAGFGFSFGSPLGGPMPQTDVADQLARSGPQFPQRFSMSCAPVQAFMRGGWPVVVDYQPTAGHNVVLEVHTQRSAQPYIVPLDARARRQLVKIDLPRTLGDEPQVALFLVRSIRKDGSTGGRLQLFGLGAGPKAVGSVAIDQVEFQPGSMRVSQKQKASYSFFSRSDFNRSVVEILRVERGGDEIKVSLARAAPLPVGINRGTWVGKTEPLTWDGTDANNRISSGPHLLQVRAWLNAQDDRDWVAAWSPSTVVVSE